MCQNAQANIVNLMSAIEPTVKNFLAYFHVDITTGAGKAVIDAYEAALAAVQTWQKGTPSENVIQIINDFSSAFAALAQTLNIPPQIELLVSIISAGIIAVIGAIKGNSPAPATQPADSHLTVEEAQENYEHVVIAETTAEVSKLVPNFKRSLFHTPAHQYTSYWNKTIDSNGLPTSLKV